MSEPNWTFQRNTAFLCLHHGGVALCIYIEKNNLGNGEPWGWSITQSTSDNRGAHTILYGSGGTLELTMETSFAKLKEYVNAKPPTLHMR